MEKPSKRPQIIEDVCDWLGGYVDYSPAYFRDLANKMDDNKIKYIKLESDSYICSVTKRMETADETKNRYLKELKEHEEELERSKIVRETRLIEEAKALGFKLVKE